jgi:ElaB/YqjD/DUF883 family membrane-anchored ribosome-binding protein
MSDEYRDEVSESTAAARQDIEATRARMSGTIAEIEQRISGRVESVRQKVDVVSLVRQHPWPALAAAFVAGVALSASGADRRAARATREAAKGTPEAARRAAAAAARATGSGVSRATGTVERVLGLTGDRSAGDTPGSGGLKAKATGAIQARVQELKDEVRRGADELGGAAPPPGSTS